MVVDSADFPKQRGAISLFYTRMSSSDVQPAVPAEPLLRLSLFGQMRAVGASGRSVLPRSRKTRAVLAILALASPKPVLRSKLTGLLWSQRAKEQARGSLRQSVHELQRALGHDVKSLATAPPISRAIATPLGLDRAPRDGVCGCWEAVVSGLPERPSRVWRRQATYP